MDGQKREHEGANHLENLDHTGELHCLFEELGLKYEQFEEYNGSWFVVKRRNFDLFMLEEPYQSLIMLLNISTQEYIFRVLGTTRERGFYSDLGDLHSLVKAKFEKTVACVGNPRLRTETGAVRTEHPFSMLVSPTCLSYYKYQEMDLSEVEVSQGRGRCSNCRTDGVSEIKSGEPANLPIDSDSTNDEDMKIIPSSQEAQQREAPPVKKKRGRPRKIIPLEQLKNRRKLSDKTKQKIAENNRKFSICKLCNKQCKGFRGLVDHMHKDHSDHKPWQCSFCDTSTAFVKTLYRHLKQKHGVNDCPCPKCGKTYSRAQSMLFHMSKHEEEEMEEYFECSECMTKFKKKEKLEQHIFRKHQGGFECEYCNKKFSEQSVLKDHIRTHTKEKPFQCTECGMTFSFQSTFLTHQKMHFREAGVTEEEAKMKLYYFCDICGKSYANNAGLKMHKLHVHEKYSEEVPCDICGVSFRTRELLKQHQERHHSETPRFSCDECGQRFGNNHHLKRHMLSHSPEGFPCNQCSRVFSRKDGLDTHMKNHSKHESDGLLAEKTIELSTEHSTIIVNQSVATPVVQSTITWSQKDAQLLTDISEDRVYTDLNQMTVSGITVENTDLVQETINIAIPDLIEANRQMNIQSNELENESSHNSISIEDGPVYEPPAVVSLPITIPVVIPEPRNAQQSLLSQISQLSKYKCTTVIREDDRSVEQATMSAKIIPTDSIPILEPHMSTPIDREPIWSHVQDERPQAAAPRQSVIQKIARPQ